MHSALEQLHASYAQLLMGQSAQALEVHPANDPTRWNARQIVEHLILTYQSSSAVFCERLAKGRAHPVSTETLSAGPAILCLPVRLFPHRSPGAAWSDPDGEPQRNS